MDISQNIKKRNNNFNIFDCLSNKKIENMKKRQFSHSFNRIQITQDNKLINSNNFNTISDQMFTPLDLPKIILNKPEINLNKNKDFKRNSVDSNKDHYHEHLMDQQFLLSDSLKKNYFLSSSTSSSRWRKLSNFMKSISILKSLSTKIINDDEDFDKNLKEYKEKSTKNNSPSKSINIPKTKDKKEFMFKANLEINNELLRFHLKEEFMKLIFDGGKNLRENLDNLLELNPDRFSRDTSDQKYLFNELLHNGKNLMYIACREGNVEVLKYMLDKKMNPYVLSKLGEYEVESCLQVGVRWKNIKIVEILLDNVKYSKHEINELLNINDLNVHLKLLLRRYLEKYFDKEEVTCVC